MSRSTRSTCLFLSARAAALCALALPVLAQLPTYTVEVIGDGFPASVDSHGRAVGWKSAGAVRAWVSDGSGASQLLPLPPGMASSRAFDINDAGVVAGLVSTGGIGEMGVPVTWTPTASGYDVALLPLPTGYTYGAATALNDVGDVLGWVKLGGFAGGPAVLFSDPSGPQLLNGIGFVAAPADVNDQRQVVGGQLRLDLDTMVVEDLGVPPGSYWWTVARRINESGQVTGYAQVATGLPDDQRVARYTDGVGWQVLSAAGVYNSGYGISESGLVSLEVGVGAAIEVAVWVDGFGLRFLEDLIDPADPGWAFTNVFASDVNDLGQIVVVGGNNLSGQGGVLLLTPDTCSPPVAYCETSPNSVGPGAVMSWQGTPSVGSQDLTLSASGCPPGQLGIFYYGPEPAFAPLGQGVRCIAPGALGAYRILPVVVVDPSGTATRTLDWSAPPVGSGPGALLAGQAWNFQFWYRDGTTSNLSDALRFLFCP